MLLFCIIKNKEMEDSKKLIKDVFLHIFESPGYDEALIDKYFSPHYVQHVDGKTLKFEGFKQHIKVVKDAMASVSIQFKTLIQDDHIVFSNHLAKGTTKEGRQGEVEVIAEFHIRNNRIYYCNELTRQLSGDERDRDLGSRI
jgi:hypothetical protein